MLKNKNIICISSIDWDFIWQGHQEIMSTFAKNGNRVLFIENTGVRKPTFKDIPRLKKRIAQWLQSAKGFRSVNDNIFVYSPVILPFPYSKIARIINKYMLVRAIRRWMRIADFRDPIIWTFLPTGTALDIIYAIDHTLLIYYCIADFYSLTDAPKEVKKTEDELIKMCDCIFAQGEELARKCRRFNDRVHIFPFGVNMETFETFTPSAKTLPDDLRNIPKPIIGYIGGIHKHIDFNLLKFAAESNPGLSFVLVGPLQTETPLLEGIKNVYLLGKKDFSDLPRYVHEFNACIIPYQKNDYTQTVFPTKLNEYHAMGKPVISTDLPEIAKFNAAHNNLIYIRNTPESFSAALTQAQKENSDSLIQARKVAARKNSWTARINEMSAHLEELLKEKHNTPPDWKETFLTMYRRSRQKACTIAAIALSAYFLLFYTPLVWMVARPLRIAQPPAQADCIVVLGGGVGETGKANQGYEERVQYAVELYKKGFAKHILFSSGYLYVYEEPLIMKALAISLGVPAEAILLEDKARNTYENIAFSKRILEKKGWHTIMLISSPYHMRRVSLVAKKIAADMKIIYTPIPYSNFYAHDTSIKRGILVNRISLAQLKALCYEFCATVIYIIKGYASF